MLRLDSQSTISITPNILVYSTASRLQPILESVNGYRLNVVIGNNGQPISSQLKEHLSTADIVLLDVTPDGDDVLKIVKGLISAIGISNVGPRLLCFSTVHRNPHFGLAIERYGARYVRVNDTAILMEAVELLLAETHELMRIGPCFRIIHDFSQGSCAPGEAVSAVELVCGSNFYQLPLGLSQRLLFDFLCQHRRIAVDSSQLASGLSADWFYREHALNSGRRQVKKIRRPTVKVLVQRIREAMARTFVLANLQIHPSNVLRSCPAEGSRTVLYKMQAAVYWHHVSRISPK